MKVLTKCVEIQNQRFVLIEDENEQYKNSIDGSHKFYGTIPYTELDGNGRMKRALNGFEICMTDSIPKALTQRENDCKVKEYKENNPNCTQEELGHFIMELLGINQFDHS